MAAPPLCANVADSVRFDSRGPTCRVAVDNTEPASLLKRAEQLMFHAETIVDKALDEKDYRLVLAAIDRARPSMELVMRATGQIGSDGTTIERRCEAPKRRTVREAVD